tara:strand:- start:758 stop:961 length:204 start_codon:yes stop_codon:yes gene_type:complete
MIDTEKYEGLIDVEGYIDYDGLDRLLAEVKRLQKELKEAEDVIAYALEMTSEDDAIAVFKDFLGVEE